MAAHYVIEVLKQEELARIESCVTRLANRFEVPVVAPERVHPSKAQLERLRVLAVMLEQATDIAEAQKPAPVPEAPKRRKVAGD